MKLAQLLFLVFIFVGCNKTDEQHSNPIKKVSNPKIPQKTITTPKKDLPIFNNAVTPQNLALSANELIAMGENTAVQYLQSQVKSIAKDDYFSRRPSEIAWMCKLIFEAKTSTPLRPPAYGALMLPYESMPISKWPLFPLVMTDSVVFLLDDGYALAGLAERPSSYITYCMNNGTFRNEPHKVPTNVEAHKALEELFKSQRWLDISWSLSEPNRSYSFDEQGRKNYMLEQITTETK